MPAPSSYLGLQVGKFHLLWGPKVNTWDLLWPVWRSRDRKASCEADAGPLLNEAGGFRLRRAEGSIAGSHTHLAMQFPHISCKVPRKASHYSICYVLFLLRCRSSSLCSILFHCIQYCSILISASSCYPFYSFLFYAALLYHFLLYSVLFYSSKPIRIQSRLACLSGRMSSLVSCSLPFSFPLSLLSLALL